jgi:hypothetical protein
MKKKINSLSNQDGLAVYTIHVKADVWSGHRIYTTNEIFLVISISCLGILLLCLFTHC